MTRHDVPPPAAIDGPPEYDLKHLQHSGDRHPLLAKVATVMGGCAILATSILQTDIALNKHRLAESEPQIHSISSALQPEHTDRTTIYMDGFAGNDGSNITRDMTPSIQQLYDSNTAALEYDKDGISIPAIAEHIAQHVEENDISSVSLHGYSIGGMIALETAALLQEEYHIPVSHIILDHSPADADSIKPTMRDQDTALFVNAIGTAKHLGFDVEYSSIARGAVDLIASDKTAHLKDSTTALMRDQFMYGTTLDTNRTLAQINDHATLMPTLVYVTSTTPDQDQMVELVDAERKYHAAAKDYGFRFLHVAVEKTIHSHPDQTSEAYEAAFETAQHRLDVADAANLAAASHGTFFLVNDTYDQQYQQYAAQREPIPNKDREGMASDEFQQPIDE